MVHRFYEVAVESGIPCFAAILFLTPAMMSGIIVLVLTPEEATEFKARWQLVNERTAQEIRDASPEEKLNETAMMFEAAHDLGWVDRLALGEEEVRSRWVTLKERLGV